MHFEGKIVVFFLITVFLVFGIRFFLDLFNSNNRGANNSERSNNRDIVGDGSDFESARRFLEDLANRNENTHTVPSNVHSNNNGWGETASKGGRTRGQRNFPAPPNGKPVLKDKIFWKRKFYDENLEIDFTDQYLDQIRNASAGGRAKTEQSRKSSKAVNSRLEEDAYAFPTKSAKNAAVHGEFFPKALSPHSDPKEKLKALKEGFVMSEILAKPLALRAPGGNDSWR